MKLHNEEYLDYEDIAIRPKTGPDYITSRNNVNVYKSNYFQHNNKPILPIMATNMYHTGTFEMARSLSGIGALTCLHKFYNPNEIVEFMLNDPAADYTFYSMGVSDNDIEKFLNVNKKLNENKKEIECELHLGHVLIDVANGYIPKLEDTIKSFRDMYPHMVIMAGNVATGEGVERLAKAGANIVRAGISSGSVCTTRKVTGVGVPMFSMALECVDAADQNNVEINLDGGCKVPGDVAKAFGVGADYVTLGGMLSGHNECSGNIENGKMKFYGMSSDTAMNSHGMKQSHRIAEGKTVEVAYKGEVLNTMKEIIGGIRSACTYSGTNDLMKLHEVIEFIKVRRQWNTIYGN